MKINTYSQRLVRASVILFTSGIFINLISCSNDINESDATEQNNVVKYETFSQKLMESPVYFQYLNAKIDLLLEYNLILESKTLDAASRIRSHFQSPKFKSVGTDYDTLVQTLDLTKDEAEILSMLSSQFYDSTIELKKMFEEHGFHNEYDSNIIFNNIVMSEHNQNILFDNLIQFNDSNASVEKNRARRCRGPWIRCMTGTTAATLIFTAGCVYSIYFGPEAVFGCLGTDSILANAAFTRCYMRWIRCMG